MAGLELEDPSQQHGGLNRILRYREALMGDVVESQPAFIGKPTFNYAEGSYNGFVSRQSARQKVVFLGSNDGMLHAFDANNGQELWAYVPSMVIPNMWKLADKELQQSSFLLCQWSSRPCRCRV